MSEKPIFIRMKKHEKHRERLQDNASLFSRVSAAAAICSLALALLCWFLLDIGREIPYVLGGFALVSTVNLLLYRWHQNLTAAYYVVSLTGLLCTLTVVLYSGGIHSPFLFMLGLLILAGFATSRLHGQLSLMASLFLIALIYAQEFMGMALFPNVVSEAARGPFALLSTLMALYLLGGAFGSKLLGAHHRLYRTKGDVELRLREKEMLLKEVHHRVKNNLQTVSSLLRMQSRNLEDAATLNVMRSSQNRVVAMAMVHEMLYQREDLSKIEYRTYVQELGDYLIKSIKGPESRISLRIDIPQIELGIDTAIPLGLLINEAITNALKYGFKDQEEGEISIVLEKEDQHEYILRIGDNGAGFPESLTHKTSKSLGLKLIHNLSRQLQGSVMRDLSKKGTNYVIRFQEVSQAPFHTLA